MARQVLLLQVHGPHVFQIGNGMGTFIGRYAVVHRLQFLLQKVKPLVYEMGSTDHHLVLVLNPFLVVDLHQRIQNLLCLFGRGISDFQVDNR